MKMWLRNLILVALCVGAAGLVASRLLQREPFVEPQSFSTKPFQQADFQEVVNQVNDAFAKEWKTAGLQPMPLASELTIARRLSLGLTGTIPSFEEVRALEVKTTDYRMQWWLTHLFEDRRFSDYVAERFVRALVGVEDGPFIVFRRHRMTSWLSDQIFANRPYDDLVRNLITSEGIWTSKPEVNFVTVTIDQNNDKEGPDEVKLAGRVSRAFLGVRLDCVQCHDDFFGDRWKQKDFHQLASFFAGSEMSLTGLRDDPKKEYEFRYLRQKEAEKVPAMVPFQQELLPKQGALRTRLAEWVTHPDNRPFARTVVNRVWALMFSRPLHQPIDSIPLEGPFPPGMEILADDLIAHNFDLQHLIRIIAATQVFQLDSRSGNEQHPSTPEHEKLFAAFPLTRLRPEQMASSVIQSSSLNTIDADSHVMTRMIRFFQQSDFVKRYGDLGEDEFDEINGTIPQRLVLMNGELVKERTGENIVMNAATRIGALIADDTKAVETAYLTTLTRRPTPEESSYFVEHFQQRANAKRADLMSDLFWTLINSTEFSWNH